jgi:sec-independent protein translocase protein TatA
MFAGIGTTEIIIIGVVLVLLFGSKKIVELARGLGESSKELKKVKKEFDSPKKEA